MSEENSLLENLILGGLLYVMIMFVVWEEASAYVVAIFTLGSVFVGFWYIFGRSD